MTTLIEFMEAGFNEKPVLINPEDISSIIKGTGARRGTAEETTMIYLRNQTYYEVTITLAETVEKLKPFIEMVK